MVEMIHDLRKLIEILVAAIKTVKIGRVFQTKGLARNWRSNNFERKNHEPFDHFISENVLYLSMTFCNIMFINFNYMNEI